MKLPEVFLIVILLLALGLGANGQEPPKASLVDEFSNLFCTEHNRAKIDSFLLEIQRQPGSVGYVIGNADASIPGRFQKYFRSFQAHILFRQFDPDRVKFFRGPNGDAMEFQFWVVPRGAIPPETPRGFHLPTITGPILYDASAIVSIKDGEVYFGEDDLGAGEPCDWSLDLNHFATMLNADPELVGYLMASSKGRRDVPKAKSALKVTAGNLAKLHGIPSNRIKTVYAGRRGKSEMQLWLVPKGSPRPEFRIDAHK